MLFKLYTWLFTTVQIICKNIGMTSTMMKGTSKMMFKVCSWCDETYKTDPGAHSPLPVHELCSFVTRLLSLSVWVGLNTRTADVHLQDQNLS